jgi:hypothetical protein
MASKAKTINVVYLEQQWNRLSLGSLFFLISGNLSTFGIGIFYNAVGAFKEEVEGIMYVQMFAVSFYKTQRIICLRVSCMINIK